MLQLSLSLYRNFSFYSLQYPTGGSYEIWEIEKGCVGGHGLGSWVLFPGHRENACFFDINAYLSRSLFYKPVYYQKVVKYSGGSFNFFPRSLSYCIFSFLAAGNGILDINETVQRMGKESRLADVLLFSRILNAHNPFDKKSSNSGSQARATWMIRQCDGSK